MGRLLSLGRWAVFILVVAGLAIRFTVRDSTPWSAPIFYGTPLPLVAAGCLALALFWSGCFLRTVSLLAAVATAAWWLSLSYHRPPVPAPNAPAPRVKVVFWNMAHQLLPSTDLEGLLQEFEPDIVGLVEVGKRHADPNALIPNLPSGWAVVNLPQYSMALLVRGEVSVARTTTFKGSRTRVAHLHVRVRAENWQIVLADVDGYPLLSREEPLALIRSWGAGQGRTLVMGDFNTPGDSIYLDPWRKDFRNAFEIAGEGITETWPRQAPVLWIDHVWTSLDIPAVSAQKRWLPSSDHAALLVELP